MTFFLLGLIFGCMIGAIVALRYSDKRIGKHFADVATAFRAID